MFGAIAKAFGATGKAIGKGAKTGAKGIGSNIKRNLTQSPGGMNTDPSQGFMERFKQKIPAGIPGAMESLANAGQPPQEPQQSSMGGFMKDMSPLIQTLLAKYQSPQGPQPAPQQMGQPPGIPSMGGMGMDVGPTMPFEQMYGRGRMHGQY